MFTAPVDIANRACDHCGVASIDVTAAFTENSDQAALFGRIYDGLRRAELQRNAWRFAIKKAVLRPIDTNTMLLTPAVWAVGTTYFVGSIVADAIGTIWVSNTPDNLGNEPGNTSAWDQYYGPLTVSLYDSTQSYYVGELVYTKVGDGTFRVYMSLLNGNSDNPATATAWDPTVTYFKDQIVTYLSVAYMSKIDLNLNQTPNTSPSAWTTTFTAGTGSVNWREIGGVDFPTGVNISTLNIIYPLGSGPSQQSTTRNVYRLPANYLRRAPQDPKAGGTSVLGAPSGLLYDDWEFESNYIVTMQNDAITFRFIVDWVNVRDMTDLFCEGLSYRLALAGVIRLTQSQEQFKIVADSYRKFMTESRLENAIEVGSEEAALDDLIACRA